MTTADDAVSMGTWRKGEFVRWTDLFSPIAALVMWIGLVVVVGAIGGIGAVDAGVSQKRLAELIASVQHNSLSAWLAGASFYLVLMFYFARVARRVGRPGFVAALAPAPRGALVLAAANGIALAIAVLASLSALAQHSIVKFHTTAAERTTMPHSFQDLPITIVMIALLAPIVEELYFRGIFLSWLKQRTNVALSVLISAVVFGLFHFRFLSHPGLEGWVLTAMIMIVGLVNAIWALRTRSVWPPFTVHASYNFTLLAMPLLFNFAK